VFQKIHPKFKTPSFATIITGLVVGIPILFTDKTFVLDFTSIATLFAFVLVCGGVLLIPKREKTAGKFNLPYINSRFIFPAIIIGALAILAFFAKGYFSEITEMKLNDSDKRKTVYSVIADAKSDFHDNYMLTSNEINIIAKKIKGKILSDSLTSIIEHNNKSINDAIDSIVYLNITTGPAYKNIDQETSDTLRLMSRPYPEIMPDQLHSLDIKTINIVEATLKGQDSALLAKFDNQIFVYDLFGKESGIVPDSNFVNVFSKKLTAISAGDIRSESAGRLESKTTINISTIIFWIICILLAVFALVKQWSLIPLLGLTTCLYLLTGMTKANWIWFGSWLAIGLILYFMYGYKKSKLANK
jgi:amino acid transporter